MKELADWLLGKDLDGFRKEVRERNAETTDMFLLFGMILSAMILAVQIFVRHTAIIFTNVIMFMYFFLLVILRRTIGRKMHRSGTVELYSIQIPMVLFAILMGTVFDPGKEAFTILVILASFPLCIIDKPYRLLVYIAVSAALFLCIDAAVKPQELFAADLNHVISSTLVSIAATMFVLGDRRESLRNLITIRTQSQTDTLTGILNRTAAQECIQESLNRKEPGVCILADLDNFKSINDRWGHLAGDEILRHIGQNLRTLYPGCITGRYGGDEFLIYMPHITDPAEIRAELSRIPEVSGDTAYVKRLGVTLTVSIGCAVHDGSCESVFRLFSDADAALYHCKKNGKNGIEIRSVESKK